MFCTPNLFAACNELKAWGVVPPFEVGSVVARGFADIGSEEFLILPGDKLLSLSAGTIRDLPHDHRDFFFWVPSIDECARALDLRGARNLTVSREPGRRWIAQVEHDSQTLGASDTSLQLAMVYLLLELLRSAAKSEAV